MNFLDTVVVSLIVIAATVFPGVLPQPDEHRADAITLPGAAPAAYPQRKPTATEPVVGAKGVLVTDLGSGATLFTKNEHDTHPIASLTKMMTALIVLQRTSPSDIVTVGEVKTTLDESRMELRSGEQLTVDALLAGMMIQSANDAASALAVHVAGSEEAFVALMNDTAKQLGLQQTHYKNPTGLDSDGAYSTAADQMILARLLIDQPRIASVVAQANATVTNLAGRSYPLTSSNKLLGGYLPVAGLKTGTTDAAGQCLVAVVSADSRRVAAIVLNSPDRFQETKSLLDWSLVSFIW